MSKSCTDKIKHQIDELGNAIFEEVERGISSCSTWAIFMHDGNGGVTVFDAGCCCQACLGAIARTAMKHAEANRAPGAGTETVH